MTYLVLSQAKDPSYNDREGCWYHFPYTYRSNIEAGARFVYYRPQHHCYFGDGRIGRVIPDPKCTCHWYATIVNYRPFPRPVYYKGEQGDYLEARPDIRRPAFMRAVRGIDREIFCRILHRSGLGDSTRRVGLMHRARHIHLLRGRDVPA